MSASMRAFVVPAAYAGEVERVVASAVRQIYADMALRDSTEPFPRGFIEDDMIDHARTGDLVIVITGQPAQAVA